MVKMYHQYRHAGGSSALWEENWRDSSFDEALRFCDVDPLRPLFERYVGPGTVMLEGGCGVGQYVAYYAARGATVVGLDFARQTLTRLHARDVRLTLCAGDVSALPFGDAAFDVYYSGGVVEHFEAGAEVALREAWRVLRPGGVLLISVPYFSPLRRVLLPFKSSLWKRVTRAEVSAHHSHSDRQFWQYAYTQHEFKRLLTAGGFRVVETQGYAILWGLYDVSFLQRALSAWERRRKRGRDDAVVPLPSPPVTPVHRSPGLLKRLVVSEDAGVPVAGWVVRALRWACANMMMYVCVRVSRAAPEQARSGGQRQYCEVPLANHPRDISSGH